MVFSNPYLIMILSLLAIVGIPLGASGVLPIALTLSDREILTNLLKSWPAIPWALAQQMIEKYGLPHEASASRLIWYGAGPWKRMVVCCEPSPPEGPPSYNQYLEQTVDLFVPLNKVAELASFSSHLVLDRARHEVSIRCYNEAANFLTINLARQIVFEDLKSVEARRVYTDNIRAFMRGHLPLPMSKVKEPHSAAEV